MREGIFSHGLHGFTRFLGRGKMSEVEERSDEVLVLRDWQEGRI